MNDQPAIIINCFKKIMATITNYIATGFLVLILMASPSAAISSSISATTDLARAIEEMQRANYFTFIVLIDLAPPELIQGNLTFLMPKDKTLSGSTIASQSSIADFLLRHSIPSPLPFEHLQRFPTGSVLPTSKPGFFLNITNGGSRRSFFLNNVRITSPDICTSGSSIRCHGIDGVIQPLQLPATPGSQIPLPPPLPPLPPTPTPTPPDHESHQPPSPSAVAEAPPLDTQPSAPEIGFNLDPSTPPPSSSNHQHKSDSRPQLMIKCDSTLLKTLTICLMLLAMKLSM